MRRAIAVLSVLTAIALPGLSSVAFAEDRVVRVKVTADSPQEGVEAFRAMDGDPKTIWHTCWRPNRTPQPHEIVVDLESVYEITGFTYLPAHRCIKDYEVYLSDSPKESTPLAEGTPIAKGAFTDAKGESVVKFDAPVKGRYFRLRSLSAMGGQYMGAAAELRIHCEGVKFTAKPLSMAESFPEAGKDVIALIEGFPLLARLLELSDPWNWDAMALKKQLIPEGTEPFPGSGDPPAMFVNRRAIHDWRNMKWQQAAAKKPADSPGLKVWNYRAYETNYYAVKSASPFIRLHMGRPLLAWVKNMKSLYPEMPQSARRELVSNMDKIVAALAPYGAKKLPAGHKHQPYLLPGGTKMTICDYTVVDRPTDRWDHEVRVKIDFEPATPIKGREQHPFFVRWRTTGRKWGGSPSPLGPLAPLEAGDPAPATGEEAAKKWSDRPGGFAAVDAMGQNGTTGGAGGKVVTVTTQADLKKYAQAKEPYVIRVKGEIKFIEKKNPKTRYEHLTTKEMHIASNKTIVGVGKSGHIVNGGFFIGPGTHNVILRNLTIRDTFLAGDWHGIRNDFDGLQMDGAHHIWVDHCHFRRHGDGCLDNRAGTTYVTVSWCIFSDHNKTFGCGWDTKTTMQMTLHHTWFRNTACRAPAAGQLLRAHFYNNHYQGVSTYGHFVVGGANLLSQNCLFEGVNRPFWVDGSCTMAVVGNVFRHTGARNHLRGRPFFDPNRFYAFPLDKAEELPELLKKYAGPQENIGK
ncbi:MAG: discoidin domain-containing protein [Planctomycetota bacterium]